MKESDLKKMQLIELTPQEYKNKNGGWIQLALAIAAAAIYIYNNADDFVEGFKEGQAAARR
jgi:hypothetical protein